MLEKLVQGECGNYESEIAICMRNKECKVVLVEDIKKVIYLLSRRKESETLNVILFCMGILK